MSNKLPALLLFLTISLALHAQSLGILHGAVMDESGALVPGAKVTVSNAAGAVKSVTSGDDGTYSIAGLARGKYTVVATSPGLAQVQPASVDLSNGGSVLADLKLRVAAEKQEITVQEDVGPALSTDPSQNAGALVLKGEDLEALSDDPDDLQSDLEALAGPSAGPAGGQIYIDGFTGGTLPAKESIREIRINQNPFSPEFDKLGYGRIEILTKPGTDKFHGNAYFNYGDDLFNSRNPYAEEKAPFLLRDFGGTLSGPINKNASFFIDVSDRIINNGGIINGYSPIDFLPSNGVYAAPLNRLRISPRLDYQLGKSNTLTVRYGYTRNDQNDQGVGNLNLLSRAYHLLNTDNTVQIIETAVLSAKVINETHLQWYHTNMLETSANDQPSLNVQGAFTAGGAQLGRTTDTENDYEFQNYTTIANGAHSWKFGIRVRAATINNLSPSNFGGAFTFAGDATLTSLQLYQKVVEGIPGYYPSSFSIATGNPLLNVNQVDVGPFVGDDWRVRPNFTLSLGLRWEWQTNINDHKDWAPRIGFAYAPGQSKTNPRPKLVFRGGFGFFYDRFNIGNVETADRYNGILQQQYVETSPTFFADHPGFFPAGGNLALFDPLEALELVRENGTLAPQTKYEIDRNLRAPYIMQSAITVERQLPKNTTVSLNYINSHGLHELRSQDINAPVQGTYTGPGTGVFPYAPFTGPILLMESSGLFNQNQLITSVRSQVNSRISLNGFYMFGHAHSNTDGVNTLPANPYSMAGEYGPSALDVHHRVFIGGSIATRWNFRLSPFIVINSGAPFDIVSGTDPFGTTIFNTARPGIASGSGSGIVCKTGYECFNPNPTPGEEILTRNSGRSPGNESVNLRLAKTFGFGPTREGSSNAGGGNRGGGPGGGPGGGRGPGGPGGPMGGMFGNPTTSHRYNLTLSVQARNLLNHVNPGPINGIVTSPLFGESNALAGGFGAFSQPANNRRLEFQARFTF
jgi:carboxypeptidase family protein